MWEVNLRDNLGSDHYMKLAFADGPRKLLLGTAVFAFSP
jgi:hypothetical protein